MDSCQIQKRPTIEEEVPVISLWRAERCETLSESALHVSPGQARFYVRIDQEGNVDHACQMYFWWQVLACTKSSTPEYSTTSQYLSAFKLQGRLSRIKLDIILRISLDSLRKKHISARIAPARSPPRRFSTLGCHHSNKATFRGGDKFHFSGEWTFFFLSFLCVSLSLPWH